jgi:hypothetical protein
MTDDRTTAVLRLILALCLSGAGAVQSIAAQPEEVPRFGIHEVALESEGDYENPYWEVQATAELTGPQGESVAVDLFWDGEKTWMFRYAPPKVGAWRWRTSSKDAGLDGKAGEFRCVESDLRGAIRPMKGYPFHFECEDGTPFWLFGDTLWDLYGADPGKNYTRDTFEQYVKLRAGQKFNFVEGILTSPPSGNEGGPIFRDKQQRALNVGFFREVDERIAFLNRYGLTAMMFLSWSNPQSYIFSWRYFADQEARERYARYVMSRYGAYNVCFGITGEWNAEKQLRASFEAIGTLLHTHNPQGRMIAIHPFPNPGSTREFADQPWMSFGDYEQNYGRLHEMILQSRFEDYRTRKPWPVGRRKPVVNGEYALYMRDANGDGKVDKSNSSSLDQIRHATYDIAMAGGYFVTGFGSTYWGGYRNPPDGFILDDPIDDPWEEEVQHVYDLFTSLDWWKLEPSDHLLKTTATGCYCLAESGRQYIVYVRGARKVTVTLEAGGTYQLERLDPRTGRRTKQGMLSGGEQEIKTPDTTDHVFVLFRKGAAKGGA